MSYIINDEVIERIHDNANLVDIVSEYLPLKRTGVNFVGLCPFHNEKTPSFTVSDAKQFYHCFGCGEGGDVISFIMKMENMSFLEAAEYLANKLGIPLEEKSKRDVKIESERDRIYEINREAAKYYYSNLMRNKMALNYLQSRRIRGKVINQFGLGFAEDSWDGIYKYLIGKGYREKDLEKAGLIGMRRDNTGYYDKFRNRIIFPIIDTRNRVIGFGGRVLDETMPKYLNSMDTPVFTKGNNLYGLNLIKKHSNRDKIILVEGYMDVISLFNNGINYSVASLGTAFTQNQAKLLKKYGKEVFICYDSDEAGINASLKAINILRREGVDAKIIKLPAGEDPDDFIKSNGVREFERLLKNALNYIDYNIFINKQKYNIDDPEERIKFTQKIAGLLGELKSPIEKDVYIDKVSDETGISKVAIEREISRKLKPNTKYSKDKYINQAFRHNKDKIKPVNMVPESGYLKAEKSLLKLMIANKSYFDIIIKYLAIEDFLSEECKILAETISNEYYSKVELRNIEPQFLLDNVENINMDFINEILDQNIDFLSEDIEDAIGDLVKTINFSRIKIKLDNVNRRMKEIGSNLNEENIEEFKNLSLRQVELKNELESYV